MGMRNASLDELLNHYDIFDEDFVTDPFPLLDQIRESACPIAHSDEHGGSWLPTRHEDVVAMAQTPEIFTSRSVIVVPPSPESAEGPYGNVAAPPISSDPPEHHWHRRAILPTFAPQNVAKYEPITRDLCNRLIDGFIDAGTADAAAQYAQRIPVRVISMILGVPLDMEDEFVSWVRGVLETGLLDREVGLDNRMKIITFFMGQIEDRKANPRENDLITDLLALQIEGKPVDDMFVLGACNLMLIAGIDTTWSAIGSSLWHLAHNPDQRRQLREHPEIWPTAVEEMLRVYSPVTMARIVDHDTEFQGCPMHAGDRVLMAFPAANRDPRVFEHPDQVILDRENNRHVAFGAGIHRCAGSNLARLEVAGGDAGVDGTDPRVRARRSLRCHLEGRPGPRPTQVHGQLLKPTALNGAS